MVAEPTRVIRSEFTKLDEEQAFLGEI